MAYDPPFRCPWRCHEIGGPWISENPSCPFHGMSPVDLDELDPDEGDRMVRAQQVVMERELEEERRWRDGDYDEDGD